MQQGLDEVLDAETLQQHIDDLHNPHTLFTVCSILAMQGMEDIVRSAIYRDIMILVQLRQRDAAWDECRKKLHALVENNVGDFFSKQLVLPKYGARRPLKTDKIEAPKKNSLFAIQVLDGFFDGGAHTNIVVSWIFFSSDKFLPFPDSPIQGRLDRFLGWCLCRKRGSEPEPEQQV